MTNHARGTSGGYASDTPSMASQDGVRPKKKNARVSFDDDVGRPSPPSAGQGSMKNARGGALPRGGALQTKTATRDLANDDSDETMKPRPALPAFGSVRDKKTREDTPESAEKVTETVSSSLSTSMSTLPDRTDTSSDHAIGSVLARGFHYETSGVPRDELQKHRDSIGSNTAGVVQSSVADDITRSDPPSEVDVPVINLLPPTPGVEKNDQDPLDSNAGSSHSSLSGGQQVTAEDTQERSVADRPTNPVEHHATDPALSTMGISEPSPVGKLASLESGTLPPLSEHYVSHFSAREDTDSDDDSSIYSDAAEDLSDMEGGFASLDAIVESPMQKSATTLAVGSPPDSPSTILPPMQGRLSNWLPGQDSEVPAPGASGDWSNATAYWSSLSKQKKQQIERQAMSDDEQPVKPPTAAQATSVIKKPKQKKPTTQNAALTSSTTQQSAPPVVSQQQPQAMTSQTRPSAMKQSMRAASNPTAREGETHMRKSMRTGGNMRSSMRGPDNMSPRASADFQELRGAVPQKNILTASSAGSRAKNMAAPTTAITTTRTQAQPRITSVAPPKSSILARPMSNDSDSESSFKKNRRRPSQSTVDSAGRYNMKRSMRGSSQPPPSMADARPVSPTPASGKGKGSGRFSIRSLSPSGSFMGRQTMRTSMRGASIDSTTPTLRSQPNPSRAKSPPRFSMSGFSKAPKAKAAPTPRAGPMSGFKSRFANSDSDDDMPTRGGFRSRFADSDDDDDDLPSSRPPRTSQPPPSDLTPVRPIPRRAGVDSGDSTDLEDSDDEKRPSTKPIVPSSADIEKAMANKAAINGVKPEGTALAAGSLRAAPPGQTNAALPNGVTGQKEKRRGGVFGSLMRRRTMSDASVMQTNPAAAPSTPQKAEKVLGVGVTNRPTSPSPRSPKLQRRNTPTVNGLTATLSNQGGTGDSANWPLAPPPKVGAMRPATADGSGPSAEAIRMARTMRPDIGQRRSTGEVLAAGAGIGGVVSARTGKKKKFQGLRKIFGLRD
ncbi:hypothetical protein B0A49_12213 [Cryomyces minteri]|uniref:Uncharacterized protein n=1 Tax=Cryomyces minteri TaxID=331657 RepID=A0A4U0WHS6_9PEZI|nr:hypothetical protein B0A49_12213 [Cryomyces minteri]